MSGNIPCAIRGQKETKKPVSSSGGYRVDVQGNESGHGADGGGMTKSAEEPERGGRG